MITSLHLQDFRNYTDQIFHFEKDHVVFLGDNGRGKTNALEAIFILSMGKSWREQKATDLIRKNQKKSEKILEISEKSEISDISGKITGKISHNNSEELLEAFILPRSRQFQKNGKKITIKKLMDIMPILLFSPELLGIFSGTKTGRQRFFDRYFSQLSPIYRDHLITLYKAHKQKTALLKNIVKNDDNFLQNIDKIKPQIEPWNEIIAKNYPILWELRQKFLTEINPSLKQELDIISQKDESIFIEILRSEEFTPTYDGIQEFFQKNLTRELFARRNLLTPSRDDFSFIYRNDPILSTASRGEERSVLLALLSAQKNILELYTQKHPIFILDDVFSELDDDRQSHLARICENSQVFFSTTHEDHVKGFSHNIQKIWI